LVDQRCRECSRRPRRVQLICRGGPSSMPGGTKAKPVLTEYLLPGSKILI
jgi:hypothetical protein